MSDFILNDVEKGCCAKLAELFDQGKSHFEADGFWREIGLDDANYVPALRTLERFGLIGNVIHTSETPFNLFDIMPDMAQVVRQIQAQKLKDDEREDIVDMVKTSLRKNPITGWVVVAIVALLFVATAINQIGGAIKILSGK